jgi:outer membrane immunogenic protein
MGIIMLRKLIIGAVSVAAMATSAFAADIYRGEEGGSLKDSYVPGFSWTGLYLGANVGYAWGDVDISSRDGGFDETPGGIDYDADGVLAGGQIGYNWQRGSFVIGVEGEIGYLGAEGDKTVLASPDNFGETEFGAYGVLAARLGVAVDRSLFYVKGGWALANVETEAGDIVNGTNNRDASDRTKLDETLSGYAIGGGVEYALSQNWTVKAEYLYLGFGEENSGNNDGDKFDHDLDLHTAKVGVNYKFGGGHDALK